jgi:hypothetical protein
MALIGGVLSNLAGVPDIMPAFLRRRKGRPGKVLPEKAGIPGRVLILSALLLKLPYFYYPKPLQTFGGLACAPGKMLYNNRQDRFYPVCGLRFSTII